MVPPGGDPDEGDVGRTLVALEDLVGDPGERPADVLGVEELRTHTATPPRACEEAYGHGVICGSLPGLAGPDLKGKDRSAQHTRRIGPFMATPGTPT